MGCHLHNVLDLDRERVDARTLRQLVARPYRGPFGVGIDLVTPGGDTLLMYAQDPELESVDDPWVQALERRLRHELIEPLIGAAP